LGVWYSWHFKTCGWQAFCIRPHGLPINSWAQSTRNNAPIYRS